MFLLVLNGSTAERTANQCIVICESGAVWLDPDLNNIVHANSGLSFVKATIITRPRSKSVEVNECQINCVCLRSSDPLYVVTYYIKWVTTYWTQSIQTNLGEEFESSVVIAWKLH